jgi:hypothetical protein
MEYVDCRQKWKLGKKGLPGIIVGDATKAKVQGLKRENNRLKQVVTELSLQVHGSRLPRQRALRELGLPRSTFYRWLEREAEGSLQDRKGGSLITCNNLKPKEKGRILNLTWPGHRRSTLTGSSP